MAEAKSDKGSKENLLTDLKKKSKKKSRQNPNDLKLPPTPKLPTANVKLPWLQEAITMKILMFYHSKHHIFGCQFSNLFYSPFDVNTRWFVPTADNTKQTLMCYEISNIEQKNSDIINNENIAEFPSSENVFQAAKAKHKIDALFVQSLSPGDAARAGQARMKMSNGMANKYKKYGGNPFKIGHNHWQFKENDKRYNVRANWHSYKVEIMNYALRLKFQKYYNLIKEYVESEIPIYFVEHTRNDRHWADGNDGKGTNYLGKLLTALCWEFRLRKEKQYSEDKAKEMKWTIDTMSDLFLKWMKIDNIDVIENGQQFYEHHGECEWLP